MTRLCNGGNDEIDEDERVDMMRDNPYNWRFFCYSCILLGI